MALPLQVYKAHSKLITSLRRMILLIHQNSLDKQYTTVNNAKAGRFNLKVVVKAGGYLYGYKWGRHWCVANIYGLSVLSHANIQSSLSFPFVHMLVVLQGTQCTTPLSPPVVWEAWLHFHQGSLQVVGWGDNQADAQGARFLSNFSLKPCTYGVCMIFCDSSGW